MRKRGISTLVACQNEEITVGLCVLSFLPFSDEVIVVDNGSTDRSKEICSALARTYPEKVKFYDAPHIKTLHENRQYALERSNYQWIVRADSDYVCYTDGPYDCTRFRNHLLKSWTPPIPIVYNLRQATVSGDLSHMRPKHWGNQREAVMARVYRWFPGMEFARLGRWEGIRYNRVTKRLMKRNSHDWPEPVWMHWDVKSDENCFRRSERTNWREGGDFERFPTVDAYIRHIMPEKYGTDDWDNARDQFMHQYLSELVPYDPERSFEYPTLLRWAQENAPGYVIRNDGATMRREQARIADVEDLDYEKLTSYVPSALV